MHLNPKGRDWGPLVNWDDLGKFYTGFIVSWTVVLYAGVLWLTLHRHLDCIRLRNLPLTAAAVSFLHVYLVKIFLAYTTNGHFTCRAEFWIMSVYLPLGIAFSQASVIQFRSLADCQFQYLQSTRQHGYIWLSHRIRGRWNYWRPRSTAQRAYIWIVFGMFMQLVLTAALYASSPTLQGNWTSYGSIPYAKGQAKCRKTFEWIPSAFWQLFFTWIYGPYALYSVRHVRDTHYWRLQVLLCVIFGLPGTPLWLAAVFATAFRSANKWWVPPMWLAPGIILMQGVTVFIPIWAAWTAYRHTCSINAIVEDWDRRQKAFGLDTTYTIDSNSTKICQGSASSLIRCPPARKSQMYTMASLEKALVVNPQPLLDYAATKDFTAENIVFLVQVRQWRCAFSSASTATGEVLREARADLFASAVEIYMASVNEKTSEYPINIESSIRSSLGDLFDRAVPDGRSSSESQSDPFNRILSGPSGKQMTATKSVKNSWDSLCGARRDPVMLSAFKQHTSTFKPHPGVAPLGRARAKVPDEFNESIFEAAERSIKHLVLTNTWRRFVTSNEDHWVA